MKTVLTWNDAPVLERRNTPNPQLSNKMSFKGSTLADELSVMIHGYQYLVDFGPETSPRYHRVNKNKLCSCGKPDCTAIQAVRRYLASGGMRAPDPLELQPCPICGSKVYPERIWDGKYTHQVGWVCSQGGIHHFLQAKAKRIQQQLEENPWLIPPAPGYPGVRREEVMTWETCDAITRKVYKETGYNPAA